MNEASDDLSATSRTSCCSTWSCPAWARERRSPPSATPRRLGHASTRSVGDPVCGGQGHPSFFIGCASVFCCGVPANRRHLWGSRNGIAVDSGRKTRGCLRPAPCPHEGPYRRPISNAVWCGSEGGAQSCLVNGIVWNRDAFTIQSDDPRPRCPFNRRPQAISAPTSFSRECRELPPFDE